MASYPTGVLLYHSFLPTFQEPTPGILQGTQMKVSSWYVSYFCESLRLYYYCLSCNFLLLGPPDGTQLVGPIDENNLAHHDHYADFILTGLAKSSYILGKGSMDDHMNK